MRQLSRLGTHADVSYNRRPARQHQVGNEFDTGRFYAGTLSFARTPHDPPIDGSPAIQELAAWCTLCR